MVFMLAELAKYFEVEQALGERLGFALSAEQVRGWLALAAMWLALT